ncbi:MAG: hypothetical protein HC857_08560 [Synechococcales cyanobacterium RU_4_20]|nr:hypothetical protein [Synechococcales cyanobacterium RU_4_20]NJR67334.1 hypothetical protein [Synechococcales cyanobacterium CRU_2_2]
MKKPCPTYAAPVDREDLHQGVFLVSLRGAADKDSARNRQRAFDYIMERFEEGIAPFDGNHCFDNGLSEDDLIYIPPFPDLTMSKTKSERAEDTAAKAVSKTAIEPTASSTPVNSTPVNSAPAADPKETLETAPDPDDIILAASEILELAKLKVSLTYAYRDAREYKDLVFKIVDIEGGPLNDAECELIAHKNFAKSIKGLAEAKVKVSQWYENSSANHDLILNELAFVNEEIASILESADAKASATNGKAANAKETPEA